MPFQLHHHFPAGQLPPVNSFWSVTKYDGKMQFLIKNPINRYLINLCLSGCFIKPQ